MGKLFAVGLIVLSVTFALAANASKHESTVIAPAVPPELRLGQALYGKFCASCHGVDLKGTKKGPPFLHRVYHPGHHGDGSFFLAAKNGARAHHWKFGDMKPVEGVNESIVASIVKFVRHVQKIAGIY